MVSCPKCGCQIEISEALKKQIEEQVLVSERVKHKEELEKLRRETEEKAKNEAVAAVNETLEAKDKKLSELIGEVKTSRNEIAKFQDEKREMELTIQKVAFEERKKAQEETHRRLEEEYRLKEMEKDKKLQDAMKVNEELRRKLEQGSQQTQGEVLELEIENHLRTEFPNDLIKPVSKGVRGADVIQEVNDRNGRICGSIIWESKNAKWSDGWIGKLKDDQRLVKADLAVLLTVNLPEGVKTFCFRDGIWITNRACAIPLASALRLNLYQIFQTKLSTVGKNEKMERLFSYLTGIEFKQRVEAIVEGFSAMKDELEKEKRFFSTKWARQEKEIGKVFDQTFGMYGDLQGVVGQSLPAIKSLELPETTGE